MKPDKNIAKAWIALCAVLLPFFATPQSGPLNPKPILFQGVIEGGKFGMDSILVMYTSNVMTRFSAAQQFEVSTSFVVHPDIKGRFSFQLPPANEIGSVVFQLRGDKTVLGKPVLPLTSTIYPHYYVEPGDGIYLSVKINHGAASTRISGRGAAKYLALKSITEAMKLGLETSDANQSPTLEQQTAHLFQEIGLRQQTEMAILNYYKPQISSAMFNLIQAELRGRALSWLVKFLLPLNSKADLSVLRQLYQKFLSDTTLTGVVGSPGYTEYLILKTILNYQIKNNVASYRLSDIYSVLKRDFSGIWRDKLLSTYLLQPGYRVAEVKNGSENEYDSCLNDAFELVKHLALKKEIAAKLSKFKNGSEAYNFCLPNAAMEKVQLSDFKGKVVLVDIYGTVCTGCRIFAATLKEKVFPVFKDNPQVVFIAISTEPDKARWLKDIEDGYNTSKAHEIILYTEGLGNNHPLNKFYQINSVPTLLLISRAGKIVNSSAGTLNALTPGEEIVRMINRELQKPE